MIIRKEIINQKFDQLERLVHSIKSELQEIDDDSDYSFDEYDEIVNAVKVARKDIMDQTIAFYEGDGTIGGR